MESKPTLRDIADLAVARNGGKGGRALGRAAEQRGLTLSYTTVDKIRAGTYMSTPSPKTLEALSVLSGESLRTVYDAAGLPMPRSSFADNLPPDADLLEPEQRKVVYDVVRALARQNKELHRLREATEQRAGEGHDQRSASMNEAGAPPAQDKTRETPSVRPDHERLTEDESTDPTEGSGSHDLERTTLVLAELFREGLAFAPARAAEQRHRREVRRRVSAALDAEGTIDDATRYLAQIAEAALSGSGTAGTNPTPDEAVDDAPTEPAADRKPSKLERLRRLQEDAATLPAAIAARDVGRPSRGQQIRERQDAAGEYPDTAHDEEV